MDKFTYIDKNKIIILFIILLIIFSLFSSFGCLDRNRNNKEKKSAYDLYFGINNDEVYIIWKYWKYNDDEGSKIHYSIMSDQHFTLQIVYNLPTKFASEEITVDSKNNIHILCIELKNGQEDRSIHYYKFDNSFTPLIEDKVIIDYNARIGLPHITADKRGNLSLVWESKTEEGLKNWDLFYMKIDSDGDIIIPKTNIASDEDISNDNPRIFCDSNNSIHITWQKQSEGIYYLKMAENGTITVPPTDLYDINVIPGHPVIRDDKGDLIYLPTYFHSPGVADSKNNIHIAYNGYYEDDPYTQFVAYVRLNSTGSKIDYQELSNSTDTINEPQIKIDSLDNVHIVWKEGNQIYYTRLDDNGIRLIDKMEVA